MALLLSLFAGCASPSARPPPSWIDRPPPHSSAQLHFVGATFSAPDENRARDLAVSKALAELSQHCGAVIQSELDSLERDVNGRTEQRVSLRVQISGEELTIREARVERLEVRSSAQGGFDAFALVAWPRKELQALEARRAARAQLALARYREAQAAFETARIADARGHLEEAVGILGPNPLRRDLHDPTISDTGVLSDALARLEARIQRFEEAKKGLVAVGVDCSDQKETVACPSHRLGRLREHVTAKGLKLSSASFPGSVARAIAEARNPKLDAGLRRSGWVLAVTYDAEPYGKDDYFVYSRCGARAALYSTQTKEVVSATSVPPKKGGHVDYSQAAEKGCAAAEADVVHWLETQMKTLRGASATAASPGAP